MSLKLSRNKVNYITKLIIDYIQQNEELDYIGELENIRFKTFHLIMNELKAFEDIEEKAKYRISSQKKSVPESSREWEILFRKYSNEELDKLGKIW